jgi:hypothetical protein
MKTRTAAMAACAFALGGLVAASVLLMKPLSLAAVTGTSRPAWTEVQWPFPLDQWGTGKAFRCRAADCGTDVEVYVRAKIGFCNCTTGVADDEELDRISDFALFADRFVAQGPGHPIAVAWMKGRSRAFTLESPQRAPRTVLTIGVNDRCDAIVATAVAGSKTIEPAVIAFLNSKPVLRWAEVRLGL